MPFANPYTCIRCRRRAFGAWFCDVCGPAAASRVVIMDDVEKRACKAVAEHLNGPITLTADELPDFIAWCVEAFADEIRRDAEEGGPPF